MKQSLVAIAFLAAVLCSSLTLQSCADSAYETRYDDPDGYTRYSYNECPNYPDAPCETTVYTTNTTNEPDSIVGSTAHAVGTVIAAPFRIVGDVIDVIL
jgi:hypothetical protein